MYSCYYSTEQMEEDGEEGEHMDETLTNGPASLVVVGRSSPYPRVS